MDYKHFDKTHVSLMGIAFLATLFLAIIIMPIERWENIRTISGQFFPLGSAIAVFITFYCTPAYLFIIILSKTSEHLKISRVREALRDLERMVSFPLVILSIGFSKMYSDLMKIKDRPEKSVVESAAANIAGLLIFSTYELGITPELLVVASIFSIMYFSADWLIIKLNDQVRSKR